MPKNAGFQPLKNSRQWVFRQPPKLPMLIPLNLGHLSIRACVGMCGQPTMANMEQDHKRVYYHVSIMNCPLEASATPPMLRMSWNGTSGATYTLDAATVNICQTLQPGCLRCAEQCCATFYWALRPQTFTVQYMELSCLFRTLQDNIYIN